jgi:hypothetical protein
VAPNQLALTNVTSNFSQLVAHYNLVNREARSSAKGFSNVSWANWLAMNPSDGWMVGDPMFVDPLTGDYSLNPDSPAVDAFTPSQWQSILADLLNNSRPGGLAYDLGAYEYQPTVVPEPASCLTLAAAGMGLLLRRRRRA